MSFDNDGEALRKSKPSKSVSTKQLPAPIAPIQRGIWLYSVPEKKWYSVVGTSRLITSDEDASGVFRWTPDSNTLIIQVGRQFYKVDAQTRALVDFAYLPVFADLPKDGKELSEVWKRPAFQILGWSQGSEYMIVRNGPYQQYADVQAVSIKDGSVSTLARIKNPRGIAWLSAEDAKNIVIPTLLVASSLPKFNYTTPRPAKSAKK